ncbi:E3 ubiquitin-protein ligase TRIM71-like [Stylophora pistillata]|uniref:E3 ubiquitin-protein ligase TRIM71 n=1 Tax=Stylophora pistillata TaxID=50429 RepID=A0A2B4S1M7_STYPI|nr:E3 ubiquitin-protein ligase TRIM71-like [Stylophora pistillata]PFX23811.1 E3 ubiquitin-protein ligase TRIM71 [Stylophora pistillata]
MPERSLKNWFKLAFHLFVSDQWDKVEEIVQENDSTYRWLKEQILREIRKVEENAFRSFLGSAALNIRDRLITIKHVNPDEEIFNKVKFWLKQQTGKFVLEDSDIATEDRVLGCKIALLEASFIYLDESEMVANLFRHLLNKLRGIAGVDSAIEEKNNPTVLAQVKVINDAAMEYVRSIGQELGEWPDFDIFAEALPSEKIDYEPPAIWCFGDYGMADGQMCYPEKVAIDEEGQFLVLEEHTIGMGDVVTIQRIQLFNAKGKFLKCLLKRGEGKVNGMMDFCLTKDGNILVADENENGVGMIQIFDYEGNRLLQIIPEVHDQEVHPRFSSVAIDPDGNIIAGDSSSLSIYILSTTDGKTLCKFGKFGREEGEFQAISNVSCDDSGKIYVSDPALNRIQIFNEAGDYLHTFGPRGTHLRFLLFDSASGEVYGSDYRNHKVKVYSTTGEPLREHGNYGTALHECWFPLGLALTPDGKIAIAERENHRITVLKI